MKICSVVFVVVFWQHKHQRLDGGNHRSLRVLQSECSPEEQVKQVNIQQTGKTELQHH